MIKRLIPALAALAAVIGAAAATDTSSLSAFVASSKRPVRKGEMEFRMGIRP